MSQEAARRGPNWSSKARQYLIAVGGALVVVASQVHDVASRVGGTMLTPKHFSMLLQIKHVALSDHGVLLVLVLYAGFYLIAHLAMMVLAVSVFRAAGLSLRAGWVDSIRGASLFLVLVLTCGVMWNRRIYPQSMVFPNGDLLLLQDFSPLFLWGASLSVIAAVLLALIQGIRRRPRVGLLTVLVAVCVLFLPSFRGTVDASREGSGQPDVIIIGVDSLRADFIARNGFPNAELMPALNGQLVEMVNFRDAATPMARTFVSYMSILTGREPKTHRARFNLHPRGLFEPSANIASVLRQHGYYTLFAMDESRFANFDESFGFDEVVVPPVGILDFVIGGTLDGVATNLIMAVPAFREYSSHIFGNRAAYRLYRPVDHSRRLEEAVSRVPADKPLMLVSHFCLPHWPYLPPNPYSGGDASSSLLSKGFEDVPADYIQSLRAVDIQLGSLLGGLRARGRLRNSMLVILSDHGEGLGMERDQFLLEVGASKFLKVGAQHGHGGDILSPAQSRVVLAIQRYVDGKPVWRPEDVGAPVSLIDVAPTMMEVVLPGVSEAVFDGVSLLPVMEAGGDIPADRKRFIESGERAASIEAGKVNEAELAAEMYQRYRITPDQRFEIRDEVVTDLLEGKQRGVWSGDYGVAAKPKGFAGDSSPCWEAVDFRERVRRCVPFPAEEAHYHELQLAVCSHYAGDGNFKSRWCVERSTERMTP